MTIHKYSFGMYYFYYKNNKYIVERCDFTYERSGFFLYQECDANATYKWQWRSKLRDIRKEFKDA